jgi:hypothetical protein
MSQPPVFYLFLALCLLLAAGLTLLTLRRANGQRQLVRVAAAWLAVLGLWWMAYPPRHTITGASVEAIVLTPGYQPDSLRQVLRQLGPATRLWRQGFTSAATDTPSLTSIQALREQYPSLRRLHVLGRGLPLTALADAGTLKLVVHSSPPFQGFEQASWSRHQEAGQWLQVAGTFSAAKSAATQPLWLSLRGPGRSTDSVQIKTGQGAFRLRILPKTTGLAVYRLLARRGGKIIASEPVPVEVTTPQPLRILLLSSTASFEFTFLKNHLGARRHQVALRTGLSRGLTQTEFLNQPAHDLTRLTGSLLTRYDIVIADAGTLAALSGAENQALLAALRGTGLGLIILADAAALPRRLPARASFAVVPRILAGSGQPQAIHWPEAPGSAATLIPATLRIAATARAVAVDGSRQPVVAAQRLGLGTVLLSTLPQTYPWALQSAGNLYAAFWSHLLRAAARPLLPQAQWQLLTDLPRPQEPVSVRLTAAVPAASPTVSGPALARPVPLALAQASEVSEWSTAQFWPATSGWHQLRISKQPAHAFYVFDPSDWQGPEQLRRQQAMAPLVAAATPGPVISSNRPYSILWFFGLFVLATGFLWLEEKL